MYSITFSWKPNILNIYLPYVIQLGLWNYKCSIDNSTWWEKRKNFFSSQEDTLTYFSIPTQPMQCFFYMLKKKPIYLNII